MWVDVWDGGCPAGPTSAGGQNPCLPMYTAFEESAKVGGFSQWCHGCNHTTDPHCEYTALGKGGAFQEPPFPSGLVRTVSVHEETPRSLSFLIDPMSRTNSKYDGCCCLLIDLAAVTLRQMCTTIG